jgi:hypothetical protein
MSHYNIKKKLEQHDEKCQPVRYKRECSVKNMSHYNINEKLEQHDENISQ